MRHRLIILLEIILVAGAITGAVFIFRHPDRHDDKTAGNTQVKGASYQAQKPACAFFTLSDAKKLLGDDAKAGNNPAYEPGGTSIYTSSCTYSTHKGTVQPAGATAGSKQSATLLIRQPNTDKGTQTIQGEFGELKPTGVQDVAGYGDSAFWDPAHGEFNILKNNNWYVLSIGPPAPSGRSLDQAKSMADLLLPKL